MATKQDIAEIRSEMATKVELFGVKDEINGAKDEISGVKDEINGVKDEISGAKDEILEIKVRLDSIEEILEDHKGHAKEIDYAFQRIGKIESHIGFTPKQPATK